MNLQSLILNAETAIREGRSREVAAALAEVRGVPQELRLRFANLCRRVGLISRGLKTLHPVVHPQGRHRSEATNDERAEYAALLQRAGANSEALLILREIDPTQVPQALLFEAFCHFNRWDYEAAEPCLRNYVERVTEPYDRLVGEVNLASALLVNGNAIEAVALLDRLVRQASRDRSFRVEANCLEMRAQARLQTGSFSAARIDLENAAKLLAGEGAQDLQFVWKWSAVSNALENGDTESLQAFRAKSLQQGAWENVRESDLYLLRVNFTEELFSRLYFGTPFEGYRRRITRVLGVAPLRAIYDYGISGGPILDLQSGSLGEASVKPGKKIHQVLRLLVADFYRPQSVAGLFNELYPGEFFNIDSSPQRVRRVIARAMEFFADHKLPVLVAQRSGRYVLEFTGPFAFRVPRVVKAPETNEVYLEEARAYAGRDWCASRDLRALLKLSPSTFKRFAAWALAAGHLERSGSTHATFYRVLGPHQKKVA